VGNIPNAAWGWGKLDVVAAVEDARALIFGDGFEGGDTTTWNQ
jgi:hypothetical protein